MKKLYMLFFVLLISFSTVHANFAIFARGNKIGTYEISKKGNNYYTISKISLNLLGFKKTIIDSTHSVLNSDYSMKYFDYIHYENGKRKRIIGIRKGNKIILRGDINDTLYVQNKRVFTDIGIETILPKIEKPDSIAIISSGIWRVKMMYVYESGDTIVVSSKNAKFKYIYHNGKFVSMEGPGNLYIGKKKGNIFKKDILNSYRIKVVGKKIDNNRRYRRIVIEPPKGYTFPEFTGFQYYGKEGFIVEPGESGSVEGSVKLTRSTEYYNYSDSIFNGVLKRLKGKSILSIARYVRDIMKPSPNMYPERASEIFNTKRGDCTEYASLLTALLRGEGYPAYNVYGLVYMKGYYYYHAWVRAYTGKGWRCVDPTVGDYCDAKYIILQDDKDGGFSADINFLPVKFLKITVAR